LEGESGTMTIRSFLALDIRDGSATEAILRAGIEEAGGVVERCDSRIASRGGHEIVFILQAVPVDVFHRVMRRVEMLPGVAVNSVSQHGFG